MGGLVCSLPYVELSWLGMTIIIKLDLPCCHLFTAHIHVTRFPASLTRCCLTRFKEPMEEASESMENVKSVDLLMNSRPCAQDHQVYFKPTFHGHPLHGSNFHYSALHDSAFRTPALRSSALHGYPLHASGFY